MAQIIVKNGLQKDLSKAMSEGTVGEPIFTTDTEKFFVTNGTKVVEIGTTDPDVMEHIKNLQDTKVDKVSGKGLSTNDFTTAEKNKLASIPDDLGNYQHPATHPADMIVFTDGKNFQQKLDDGSLRGPQGPSGAQGIQGPKGDTGAQGPKGDAGAVGAQGIQGPKGDKGDTGTAGANGFTWRPSVDASGNLTWTNNGSTTAPTQVNIKGPQGPKGDTGAAGAQGIQGPQGPKGDTGAQGPNILSTSTTVSGFTSGHYLYNNNGRVAAKAITPTDIGAAAASHTHTKANIGLGNVDNVKQMPISGGTFTGVTKAQSNSSYTTPQLRNITISTGNPSGGGNGDIWLQY